MTMPLAFPSKSRNDNEFIGLRQFWVINRRASN